MLNLKNLILRSTLLITASLAVLTAIPANAQQPKASRLNIPFAFLAGNDVMPAGQYVVQVDERFRVLDLRSVNDTVVRRVSLDGGELKVEQGSEKGFFRFNRYGDSYVLTGVKAFGASYGFSLKPSKAERELARTYEGGAVQIEVVAGSR